ncbi:hypothetical protein H8F24_01070 [Synechococcus sp. CBW1002]|jgi:hypothetical protein|uniref:hypothetical protein n=1 Tax=Synechococcus sp. CBW1002 TaxID=1353134 RepID=UPI0018CF9679|nr:hypothetical protein [Synechococcus sp. CBW1002]QPN60131.1 hypothetical protein H8F24_01070 [Synechococcus sp. CBW1002]
MILRENFLHAVVMNLPPGKTSIDQSGDRGTTRFSNAPGTVSRTGSSKEPNTIVLEDRVNLGKSGNSIPEAKHHSGENVPVPRHRERHPRGFSPHLPPLKPLDVPCHRCRKTLVILADSQPMKGIIGWLSPASP